MTLNERITRIRELLVQPAYRRLLIPLSSLYLIAVLSVYAYMYTGNPFTFYESYPISFTLTVSALNIASSILLGIILTLIIAQYRTTRLRGTGYGAAGLLFGGIAMGCPGCFFGLFPLILSLFGVTATLAVLPWNGIEFQLLTIILLAISALTLAPSDECALPKRKRNDGKRKNQ